MFKNHLIITYLLIFLVLSILLKIGGIIDVSFSELAGYGFIFYGIGTVYISMGRNKKKLLFIGAVSFLVGVVLFITSNYDFLKLSNIVLPSIFFILGTGFLVLFIDDLSNKLLLAISVIFLISGIFFFTKLGTFNLSDFLKSTLSISMKYWPVIIIVTALILLLKKNSKN
jgi:hypothetical protein